MEIVVIAHDVRSTHNVGAILRSADGFGVRRVVTTGYTPYPALPNDTRLPHIRNKLTEQIAKTALGAEQTVAVTHYDTLAQAVAALRSEDFAIYALEQTATSTALDTFWHTQPRAKLALIVGNEPHGLTAKELSLTDASLEIRMFGHKESFNVSVAAGIALYELTKNH